MYDYSNHKLPSVNNQDKYINPKDYILNQLLIYDYASAGDREILYTKINALDSTPDPNDPNEMELFMTLPVDEDPIFDFNDNRITTSLKNTNPALMDYYRPTEAYALDGDHFAELKNELVILDKYVRSEVIDGKDKLLRDPDTGELLESTFEQMWEERQSAFDNLEDGYELWSMSIYYRPSVLTIEDYEDNLMREAFKANSSLEKATDILDTIVLQNQDTVNSQAAKSIDSALPPDEIVSNLQLQIQSMQSVDNVNVRNLNVAFTKLWADTQSYINTNRKSTPDSSEDFSSITVGTPGDSTVTPPIPADPGGKTTWTVYTETSYQYSVHVNGKVFKTAEMQLGNNMTVLDYNNPDTSPPKTGYKVQAQFPENTDAPTYEDAKISWLDGSINLVGAPNTVPVPIPGADPAPAYATPGVGNRYYNYSDVTIWEYKIVKQYHKGQAFYSKIALSGDDYASVPSSTSSSSGTETYEVFQLTKFTLSATGAEQASRCDNYMKIREDEIPNMMDRPDLKGSGMRTNIEAMMNISADDIPDLSESAKVFRSVTKNKKNNFCAIINEDNL